MIDNLKKVLSTATLNYVLIKENIQSFESFGERYKDFDYYRQVINNEPQKFLEDLNKIFVKVRK